MTETAIRRASSLFIDALYTDVKLKPYLLNSKFLISKLDDSKIMNKNDEIDPIKLENQINLIINQYTNSKNMLSNFGIESGQNHITMCATAVVTTVALAVAAVTVVAASAYAVVLNVGAAINATAAINLNVTVTSGDGDGDDDGDGGGSGGSCGTTSCHNGSANIRRINKIGFKPIPWNCGAKVVNNTETEIFLKDITVLLAK